MRRSPAFVALLLAAGCSGETGEQTRQEELRGYDAQEADATSSPPSMASPPPPSPQERTSSAGPDVAPTAAPGVAFNYRYAFRLPAASIAPVQEQHARTCEQLGVARCRVTGMRYRVVNDRDVQAMLAFKLEPSIARRFGQAGAEAVTRAEGMLVDAEISGTDVGTSIRATGRNIAELGEELERIEARLARGGLSRAERERLEYEAEQLRQQIRANRASREEQQESLATTPMVFEYGSGDFAPAFDTRPSFRRATERAADNFVEGVAILFIILVTLLPWVLVGLLGWWGVRLVRRRLGRAEAGDTPLPQDPGLS